MTRDEHLYVKLMEECAEVQQRTAKLLQFGPEESEPGQPHNNETRLRYELNDLLASIAMLESIGFRRNTAQEEADHIAEKCEKVQKYLTYSQELGRVDSQ